MQEFRYVLLGGVGAGKTSIIKALQGGDKVVRKTQMVEYDGAAIDTPGEYAEMRWRLNHLISTTFDAQLIVVVQDATRSQSNFPPKYFNMFHLPVLGVVTKVDLPDADVIRAESVLRSIGVSGEILFVSAVTGKGLNKLRQTLDERSKKWQTHQVVVKRSV
jgi:ethanolamine utilization protein EutP